MTMTREENARVEQQNEAYYDAIKLLVNDMTTDELLSIGGIYTELCEYLNNDAIELMKETKA